MATGKNLDELITRLEEKEKEASIIYADEETEQVVIFKIDQHLLAFPGAMVVEIAAVDHVTRIPGLPVYFSGLVTLRGTVEAVVNLKAILNIPFDQSVYGSRVLFLRQEDLVLGILTDYVQDVLALPKSLIKPALQTLDAIKQEYIIGEFEYREQQVVYLSAARVFEKIHSLTQS